MFSASHLIRFNFIKVYFYGIYLHRMSKDSACAILVLRVAIGFWNVLSWSVGLGGRSLSGHRLMPGESIRSNHPGFDAILRSLSNGKENLSLSVAPLSHLNLREGTLGQFYVLRVFSFRRILTQSDALSGRILTQSDAVIRQRDRLLLILLVLSLSSFISKFSIFRWVSPHVFICEVKADIFSIL